MDKMISYANLGVFYDNLKSHDLADKANSSEVYSKSEVDTMLAALEARIYALEHPTTVL